MDQDTAALFKKLYDEIDRLSYQSVCEINFEKSENVAETVATIPKSCEILQDCDIDELIEYSKKFVEKTRNEFGDNAKHYEEHAVQCSRNNKKLNKKLNTPPKWVNNSQKETNRATAIRIIKRIPETTSVVNPTPVANVTKYMAVSQLNNQKPAARNLLSNRTVLPKR
ncbi:uncharacterized protein LOC131681469 [Topomyia yanbarensis]|uniref:uncharacterized protein LOC131681469 n=1 Tax=Topomyia yanbarensis TaxID=2498891 RepID=UPI00273AAB3F|nr:uncharacterized protein LOC131681469 [Topomyia yanbarensis]